MSMLRGASTFENRIRGSPNDVTPDEFDSSNVGSPPNAGTECVDHGATVSTIREPSPVNVDGTFDVRYRIRVTYHVVDRNTLTGTGTSDTLSVDGSTELAPPFPGATVQATRMRVMRA